MQKKRCSANIAVFLFLTVTLTNGYVVQILNDLPFDLLSFNFRSDIMPNYTDYADNNTYVSGSVVFDPNAMVGFYRLTKNFMNSVLDPNFLNKDQIQWKSSGSGFSPALSDDVSISGLLKDYWVLVFIVVLILLITLLIPIAGLVFCCCRCCGYCGAKSVPSDATKDYSKKVVTCAIIIVLGTILLMTVVCAFATNQQMREGTTDLPQNIRKTYSDATSYLDSLTGQADHLLVQNYKEFSTVFKHSLRNSGEHVLKNMMSWNNASAMIDLNNFVDTMPDIQTNLTALKSNTDMLQEQATKVIQELKNIKTALRTTLGDCFTIPQCKETSDQISSIEFNIDVNKIPDVSLAIDKLSGLNVTSLKTAAEAGKANLDGLKTNINTTLSENIEVVCHQIDNAGTTIEENKQNMTKVITDLKEQINNINNTLENGYDYITKYSPYFYYVGLILSCILLLIPACIMLGLLWGVFGKRSEKHKSNSCSKETGSVFLISGVLFIFIFTILLGALTCVMLIFGLAVDRVVCYPLRNPEQSTVIHIIDTYIAKNNYIADFDVSINDILDRCSKDESIYKVFNLSSKLNLNELRTNFDIENTVTEFVQKVTAEAENLIPDSFSILSDNDSKTLQQLVDVNPDINIIGFKNQLNQNLLNADLQPVIESLEQISKIPGISDNIQSNIANNIQQIEHFKSILNTTSETANETLDLAETVDNNLKMNYSNFSEAISTFLNDVNTAQDQLRTNSSEIISAAGEFAELVKHQAVGYLDRVMNSIENKIGRCGHLNVAFNSALVATCDKIFMPWNGFWVALFISLLVFVPTLIVSIALASIYKNYKFTGPSFKPDKSSMRKNQNVPYPRGLGHDPPKSRYDDMAPSYSQFYGNQ